MQVIAAAEFKDRSRAAGREQPTGQPRDGFYRPNMAYLRTIVWLRQTGLNTAELLVAQPIWNGFEVI